MLDATTISKLQAVLGITNLAEIIAAEEEQGIEIPVLFTEEQKNIYGTNRFAEGKKAFGEIFTKDLKSKHPNVSYDGKNPEEFIEKFVEVKLAESGEEPDKKVAKLKAEKEELQAKLQQSLTGLDELKNGYEQKLFGITANNAIVSLIPEKTIIPRNQVLTIFNSVISTQKDEDGKIFHSKGGEPLKDELGNYKATKDVVAEFIDENKFISSGGMGGNDDDRGSSSTYRSTSEFLAGMEKRGIEPMSAEGQKILNESKSAENFNPNA